MYHGKALILGQKVTSFYTFWCLLSSLLELGTGIQVRINRVVACWCVCESEREKKLSAICVLEMDHSTGDENQRGASVEIGKDENGISHVLLRSHRGASARVRSFYIIVFIK